MAMTDFQLVLRSLRARLFSTVTTALTVALAVSLLLILLSMRNAGQEAFRRGSGNMHLLVSRDASPLVAVLNGIFYANPPRNYLEWSKYEEITTNLPIDWAIPNQQGDSFGGFPVMATTVEFFTKFQPTPTEPWVFAEGRAFAETFEVVLGAAVARETGFGVGSELFLTHGRADAPDGGEAHVHRDYTYTVVGVLAPTGGPHDRAVFSTLESGWIIHAHDRRERELGDGVTTSVDDLIEEDRKITGIYLRVLSRAGRDTSAALQPTFDALRRDPTITVAQPMQQIEQLFVIVGNIDQILLGMAGVVLLSSGIAIMLALYNSMEQRRRQIAVIRVLGCSRERVFGLVVTESAMIGLIGAIGGLIGGHLGAGAVAAIMKARLGIVITPSADLALLLPVVVGAILLAMVAGVIPAIRAYQTPVAKHLRPLG